MTYLLPDTSVALVDSLIWVDPDDRLMSATAPYRYNRCGQDLWWPPTSFAGINNNAGVDDVGSVGRIEFERGVFVRGVLPRGTAQQKTISGITKDANGAALAAVTVKAYRTSADVTNNLPADLQEGPAIVSGADGAYTACVPNADAHYCVGYKAGSPDVAGTTLNTLTGA